ncbi:RNA-binding domain-containing protein [Epithele typhae]|uniref:RNA-binding domain-containing protein n=1 Tax=Epithele typhae TaxID=378194 RepID=UPI002008BE54|nr:RNA-binding domain-containing protein [Epithele typhae]KAH9920029.1 RNA-binding domain-containing protein [Epithele typhae]
MSTLGKRKDREPLEGGEEKPHGSTLFVSNLPYTATSTDLNTLFSDIAPVRTAFVVTEQGTGISKGVGYVTFAIREDATMAIDKISKEGILLDGRNLRVQWAGSKVRVNKHHEQGEESKIKREKPTGTKVARPVGVGDPLAIRTVVVSGLPSGIDSKVLWKKVRKLPGAEKVEWPTKSATEAEDHSIAHAVFKTPATASDAVNKLHAHVFKGSLLSATLKRRMDGLAKAAAANLKKPRKSADNSTKPSVGPAPNRASRLIVRNLPFDITEQDLRAIFLPYGPIHSVHIPLAKVDPKEKDEEEVDGSSKPRTKGFAFVWFLSRKDAEKAMEGANGLEVEAGMAQTLFSDKQKKKKQRREEKKLKAKVQAEGEGEEGGEEDEDDDDDDEEDDRGKRTIAVDWALSKDKWEAEKAKLEADAEDGDSSSSSSGEEGEEDDGSDEGEDEQLGVHEGHSDEDSSDEESGFDEEDDDQTPMKPTLPAPEVGTTVFVRNVPYEATEDELRTLFRAFGPLRYARITMDHATGRSRGTAFACFWNKEDADKAIEQSNILFAETVGAESLAVKKNPFKLPSLLTPDPSASMAQNLVLHGRTLGVSCAVTRDEASKLKEAGERQREKADKRNLYLLREGIILPNTPAAENMPAAEVEKRTTSFNSRRALLRSNPSLFVSRTRLSVRQLPLFVSERMLKRLAIHAIRAFEKEAKSGTREPLTADELAEPVPEDKDADGDVKMEAADSDAKAAADKKGKKGGKHPQGKPGRNTGVRQAKIVRQGDRVDAVTGKGRSKGYGFLEPHTHADALRVLRWANNNPAVHPLFEGWWRAEFEELIAAEKKKGAGKDGKVDEARVKRIREELERGAPPKGRGTLIVEFSIENVQVVQRRAAKTGKEKEKEERTDKRKGKSREFAKEKLREGKGSERVQEESGSSEKKPRVRQSVPSSKHEISGEDKDRPKKKRRISDLSKPAHSETEKTKGADSKDVKGSPTRVKQTNTLGSVIGRKRKERHMKRAGKK